MGLDHADASCVRGGVTGERDEHADHKINSNNDKNAARTGRHGGELSVEVCYRRQGRDLALG